MTSNLRTTARTTVTSLALLGTVAAPPVSFAHEPAPTTGHLLASSAWTEPIASLGDIPLAVSLTRHQARLLGPFGV